MKSILISCFAILSLNGIAQSTQEVSLSGKVTGAKPGAQVMLYMAAGNAPVKTDSAVISATGDFTLRFNEKEGGNFYLLDVPGRIRSTFIAEGGEKLTVNAGAASVPVVITGSKTMENFNLLNDLNREMSTKVAKWNDEFQVAEEKKDKKKSESIRAQYQTAEEEMVKKVRGIYSSLDPSLLSVLIANKYFSPEIDFAEMETLAVKLQASKPDAKYVKEYLAAIKQLKGLSEGELAPDFTIQDQNDQPIALSSLRGKYVLVDFWASWCGPCRRENPHVVSAFNRFKDKGFTVFGVSLDRGKKEWVDAIQKDGLIWNHGWDVNSSAANTYNVSAIPTSYLLDKEGKIIAKNLRGPALDKKLEEIFAGK